MAEWIRCPICKNKMRLQIREDTELKNFPLYCPKCKQARKILGIKHHLSSGCCMCSGIEDLYVTRTNQSIPKGFLLALGSFGETIFIKMNTYMFSANDADQKQYMKT